MARLGRLVLRRRCLLCLVRAPRRLRLRHLYHLLELVDTALVRLLLPRESLLRLRERRLEMHRALRHRTALPRLLHFNQRRQLVPKSRVLRAQAGRRLLLHRQLGGALVRRARGVPCAPLLLRQLGGDGAQHHLGALLAPGQSAFRVSPPRLVLAHERLQLLLALQPHRTHLGRAGDTFGVGRKGGFGGGGGGGGALRRHAGGLLRVHLHHEGTRLAPQRGCAARRRLQRVPLLLSLARPRGA